jgi:elongation factor 1-gamma
MVTIPILLTAYPLCRQILAVAALTGQKIDLPAYQHYEDNKKSEFLSKFPHGKIPAFERADGFRLFEGVVIAKHGES